MINSSESTKKMRVYSQRMLLEDYILITVKWNGLEGARKIKLDISQDYLLIPREGVEDIKRMCDEFLNDENNEHQYLRIEG